MEYKNKIFTMFIYIIIFLGCILRIILFFTNNYIEYTDDCTSLVNVESPLNLIFTNFRQGANFLPGYTILLVIIYKIFGYNFAMYHIPNLIASILSLFLFKNIAKSYIKKKIPYIFSIILFAFSFYAIVAINRIKPYTIDLLCACVLLKIFLKLNDSDNPISIKTCILYSLIAMLILYFSIPAIPILLLFTVILLLKNISYKNYANIKKITAFLLFIITIIGVEYFTYIMKIQKDNMLHYMWFAKGDFFLDFSSLDTINAIINSLFFCIQITDNNHYFIPNIFVVFILILFIVGTFILLKSFYIKKQFVSLYIILPTIFFFILSQLKIYPLANRLILFLLPFIIIILLKPFDIDKNKTLSILTNILCIITIGFYFYHYSSNNYLYNSIVDKSKMENVKRQLEVIYNQDEDTAILSLDNDCALRVDTDKLIYIRDIIRKNDNLEIKYYKKCNINEDKKENLENIIAGNKKVVLIDNVELDMETRQIIDNELIKLGYQLKYSEETFPIYFMLYKIFSKD